MEPFTKLTARAAPLDHADVDTDRIIPARFLTRPKGPELGDVAFHDMRFDENGDERPEFPLNQAAYRGAQILVADANFGCGPARESAVWAIAGLGVRAVIAPSFGDIFYQNCTKNGLLPVRLPADVVADLRAQLRALGDASDAGGEGGGPAWPAGSPQVTIDLPGQAVTGPDGAVHDFDIDPFHKESLLKGLDDIDLTLQYDGDIEAFEQRRQAEAPWYLPRARSA